jgi:broad specificity phosphatase PhoE
MDYDRLSETGREQAVLLGRHLARECVRPTALFCGELRRQRETAEQVGHELGIAEVIVDPHWNEFDLDEVYRGIGPLLAADDERFRGHYAAVEAAIAAGQAEIHRQWTPADSALVRAWIQGRYEFAGESWQQFQERVAGAMDTLSEFGPSDTIAVSTSATPIAIWIGLALQLTERHVMRLAGASHNTSLTTMRLKQRELALLSFNTIGHLPESRLRTFR